MPQHSDSLNASWPGHPYVLDGILCLFGALSLAFLIGLTEEFYNHDAAGDDSSRKQLAPVFAFVAFAQACDLADRFWRLCCIFVFIGESDTGLIEWKRDDLGVTWSCGCLEADDDRCIADDESFKCPKYLWRGHDNHDGGGQAPSWWKHRSELPLQSVKRGNGEYRIAKTRQISSMAIIEDLDQTPRASVSNSRVGWADVADEANRDSEYDDEDHSARWERQRWVFVDECEQNCVFVWDEA